MLPIERSGKAGEERPHVSGQGPRPCADEQGDMVGEEGPGVDCQGTGFGQPAEAAHPILPVAVISEDALPIDAPCHDMVRGARDV